jgi:hypothetical protein
LASPARIIAPWCGVIERKGISGDDPDFDQDESNFSRKSILMMMKG